jgi:enoyl-CoA hydratase/carnithine racemase
MQKATVSEIVVERVENVLRIQFNRPERKNTMTMHMYSTRATLLNSAARDDDTRVMLVRGADDAFSAGDDLGDFLHNPPKGCDSPQARCITALIEFDKPLIAAVPGVAIGEGGIVLTHFDFAYAAEATRFQLPYVNLVLVPELGTSYWLPSQIGYLGAAHLILMEQPFDARRATEPGLVMRVVAEADLTATALDTARRLTRQPAGAARASKRLMTRGLGPQMAAAAELEIPEYASRLQSGEAREAITAFFEKPRADFTKSITAPQGPRL